MPYKLSAILDGHSNDVRAVAPLPGGSIISGSRDKTVKLWASNSDQSWSPQVVYEGHTNYVSCLAVMPANETYPDGLIYTGSNDSKIRAYLPHSATPDHILEGHEANVASLFVSKNQTLLSGSWDKTARVWLNKKTVMTLKGHEGSVWCGVILSEIGLMITGAADGNLKIWKAGQCKSTFKAHSQAIRDLVVISQEEIASCSNDGCISFWTIDTKSFQATMKYKYEDVDFIYSLFAAQSLGILVSSGENTGLKVFSDGKLSQSILVPALSTWCACVLDNGDIVVGCSDTRIYVFTSDEKRNASQELVALYEAEMTRFKQPEAMETDDTGLPEEVGGVKVADMPGPEVLNMPGRRDGQTKMVRDGNTVSVHSWSEADGQWKKVGDVVGEPKSKDPSGKGKDGGRVTYEGVEYDHVFSIDIADGVVLKLPYNIGQDPFDVAQKFINQHQLPQEYLETIADFIVKNSGGPVNFQMGESCDPFTGGNAYVSGSGGSRASSFTNNGASDPFTGGNAYTSGSGGVTASSFTSNGGDPFTGSNAYKTNGDVRNDFYPQKQFLKFSTAPKLEALKNKLLEFNGLVPESLRLQNNQFDTLLSLGTSDDPQRQEVANLIKCLRWPKDFTFPCIDITRLAILNQTACHLILSKHSEELMDILLQNLSMQDKVNNQMLALRCLANLFSNEKGIELMINLQSTVISQLSALFPVEHKHAQIAMATILLNYTIVSTTFKINTEAQVTCLNLCLLFIQGMTDSEARFRNFVTLGTLLSMEQSNLKVAKNLEAKEKVEAAKLLDSTDKVVKCANALLQNL